MDSFKISKELYCDLMKLDRTNAVNLFLYLLANADDKGVLIVSIRKISSELCIGVRTVRTLLKKMYETHQVTQLLTHQVTHKGSVITICNIKSYKGRKRQIDTRTDTPSDTSSGTPKTVEERKKDFTEKLKPYLEKYGKDMLNDFYRYWTEMNDGGKKMRFEMEKVFQVSGRLVTWEKNNKHRYKKASNLPVGMNLQNSNDTERYKLDSRWNK